MSTPTAELQPDTTPVRQVRLLLADVGDAQYLTDQDVVDLLAMNAGAVRLAAADGLEAIATSEALVSKVITTQDLSTDGAKLADALLKRADRLRAQHKALLDDEAGDDYAMLVVGGIPTDPYGRAPELTESPYIVTGL